MFKIFAKIGAVLIVMTAAFATISGGTASATSTYDCRDAIKIFWAYYDNGYYDSANAMLANIIGNGCLD